MANLRDIINAATPGPWSWGTDGGLWRTPSDAHKSVVISPEVGTDGEALCEVLRWDRDFIAAYSPDHALLIEDVLEAGVVDEFGYETDEYRALTAYRKERGYE